MSGKHKPSNHIFLNAALAVVFFAFLLSASTFLVLAFTPLYGWLIDLLKVPESTGISREVCVINYNILIDYNLFWGAKVLQFKDFPMSANGEIHFMEVKRIFVALQYTAIGTFVALIPLVIVANKKKTYWWRKAAILIALSVMVIVGTGMLFNWEGTFTLMHKLLFRNDFWLFDPATDPVIYILPDEVFLTDAGLIIALMGAGLLVEGIIYHKKTRASRPKPKKAEKNG